MEGLINVLKDQNSVITRSLSNFKKSPKDRLTFDYIETKLELLEKDWDLFKVNNTKLHELFKEQNPEIVTKVNELYDSTEDKYVTYKCLIKSLLSKFNVPTVSDKDASTLGFASKSNVSNFVKLPKISIPMFSGKYSEWTTFRDLFMSLVHNNSSLDNVQKMHYLKSHLSGEAEQLVRQTPVSDSNYSQCWTLLEKRYSNKKYLVNCILKRLFGQKRLYIESASSLKDLLDTTNDCLNALKNLNVDVTTWDVIVIHIVTFKLDSETHKQWEFSISNHDSNDLPTLKQFAIFIENRFRALECIEPKRQLAPQVNSLQAPKAMVAVSSGGLRCEYCTESHKLCFCKGFVKQGVDKRREFVLKHKICFNCLGGNHTVAHCKKQTTCKLCQKRHHSLLHLNPANNEVDSTPKDNAVDTSPSTSATPVVSCLSTNMIPVPRQVILATALVEAESKAGDYKVMRALLDQGSQACFVTEAAVQFLRLKKTPIQGIVSGLGHRSTLSKYMVQLNLQSRIDKSFQLKVNAFVISKITSYLPERAINTDSSDWIEVKNLDLADPEFNQPNRIDILLGADAYSCILKDSTVMSISRTIIAQSTTLGWILSGAIDSSNITSKTVQVMLAKINEDDILKRFWEIEDQPSSKMLLTSEEQACEEFYKATTTRREDGRYVVRLPFKSEDPQCKAGNSRIIAERRFKALEKRLEKDVNLKKKYTEVIEEYLQLGHMRPVEENDRKKNVAVYLPHHAVIRDDKTTTKIRVVFNASENNNKGVSLNDTLMVGPKLQADLRHTVLKWRMHPIGLVADIVKMYRQIRIADEDTMFQRILWRDNPEGEIRDYELVTVTFGTASAPYQAVRTLHQLAFDDGHKYPLAADRILNCYYMDDLMVGCNTVMEALNIYKQMIELLSKGGFSLQKWSSNSSKVCNQISALEVEEQKHETCEKDKESYTTKRVTKNTDQKEIEVKIDNPIKILGLTWNRREDTFQYSVNLLPLKTEPETKRAVISEIARLFDPLGWVAPVVVLAKIFIQKLWLAGLGWDEELSSKLKLEWRTYREELPLLTSIRIPRWVGTKPNDDQELHGFCDASQAAYSAVVYLRGIDVTGQVTISLLAAKTRVAPIKQISLPRLELCGAVLLSKLLAEKADVLKIPREKITAWTDSTIVLAWLNSYPSRWKTFVANRTSEILSSMNPSQWNHVSSKDNPADSASRGILPSLFIQTPLWFSGPQFLIERNIIYNKPETITIQQRFITIQI